MKDRRLILQRIAQKLADNNLKRKNRRKAKRRRVNVDYENFKSQLTGDFSYENLATKLMPPNLSFLLSSSKSDFSLEKLKKNTLSNNGIFKVPKHFSIINYPTESYKFIQQVAASLITQQYTTISIDYKNCESVGLAAQVLLDIILKDIKTFFERLNRYPKIKTKVREIGGTNIINENIKKMLFSVGSPSILSNKAIHFDDIVPYKLCIHDREKEPDAVKVIEQKDIDTTTLADYVLDSLKRVHKTLTADKLDDLCTVIGEVLINAEEHSTTKYRYSIGYFHEINDHEGHYGLFRLVILNFGKTIYEKFKDPDCPNPAIVKRMRELSEGYTRKKFFGQGFEEETLWTLYALQDGVSSVAPSTRRRGSGSMKFIESFFNIKGENKINENISRMSILSGNTVIEFDGSYKITVRKVDEEKFKVMTFNDSGSIEDKPNSKFVKFVDNYFPGTIFSAKILLNEDDIRENGK